MIIKTKIIETSKSKILVVGVLPERFLFDSMSQMIFFNHTEEVDMPQGNWQLLGRLSKLSEEQFSQVVESFGEHNGYRNYLSSSQFTELLKKTAKDSFLSLLEANGVVLENKYLKTPGRYFPQVVAKNWHLEQEKVFSNPLIFIEK